MNEIIVRWNDKDNKKHFKNYGTNMEQAQKAQKWLSDNGALNIDIAIRVKKKS